MDDALIASESMMMTEKPTVCVDLDGVLATFDRWRGLDHFGEPIVGAKAFMEALGASFRVVVFTTRTNVTLNNPEGDKSENRRTMVNRVATWLDRHGIPYDSIYAGQGKPLAIAYIDDRAMRCEPQQDGPAAYRDVLGELTWLTRRSEQPVDDESTGD